MATLNKLTDPLQSTWLCTHKFLFHTGFTKEYQCNVLAQVNCGKDINFVNFYSEFFCRLDSTYWAYILIMVLQVSLLFRWMAITIEEFLTEGASRLSARLNLPKALAVSTLIGLASSASDITLAVVASGVPNGINFNIGSLFGAGCLTFALTVPLCVLSHFQSDFVARSRIAEDICFYLVATIALLLYTLDTKIVWWEAMIYLILYVVYILIVSLIKREQSEETYNNFVNNLTLSKESRLKRANEEVEQLDFLGDPITQDDLFSRQHNKIVIDERPHKMIESRSEPIEVEEKINTVPISPETQEAYQIMYQEKAPDCAFIHNVPDVHGVDKDVVEYGSPEYFSHYDQNYITAKSSNMGYPDNKFVVNRLSYEGFQYHAIEDEEEDIQPLKTHSDRPSEGHPDIRSYQQKQIENNLESDGSQKDSSYGNNDIASIEEIYLNRAKRNQSYQDMSCWDVIQKIIDFPARLCTWITCQPVNEEDYNYPRSILCAIFAPAFVIIVTTQTQNWWTYCVIAAPITAFFLLIFLIGLNRNEPPRWYIVFTILGQSVGAIWVYLCAGLIIDMLASFSVIMNVNAALIGMTVIAIGTTLPNQVVSVLLSKQGLKGIMISRAYTKQVIALQVGFGAAQLKQTQIVGPTTLDIVHLFNDTDWSQNIFMYSILGFVFVILGVSLVFILVKTFLVNKQFAWTSICLYLVLAIGIIAWTIIVCILGY